MNLNQLIDVAKSASGERKPAESVAVNHADQMKIASTLMNRKPEEVAQVLGPDATPTPRAPVNPSIY